MMIDFHPDVVAVRLKQIKLAREAESAPSDKSNEKASASDFILAASTTIYNLNGQVGLSVDKPGTLLDAYLETKITIQDQLCLLPSARSGLGRWSGPQFRISGHPPLEKFADDYQLRLPSQTVLGG